MRKVIIVLMVLAALLFFAGTAQAAPMIILDGKVLKFDVPPTIDNSRVLVPFRTIFEAYGAKVNWDEATSTVTAERNNIKIKLVIAGSAYKNDVPVKLDVPAKIINGRTMVPLRFISESLGFQVFWNGSTQTVIIVGSGSSSGSVSDLSPPGNLRATVSVTSQIKLTWDAETGADYYTVYRATSYSGSYSKIATVYTNSYSDSNLAADTTYYYKVQAVNGSDSSSYSTIASATAADDDEDNDENNDGELSAPSDLTATAQSSSKIRLTWDAESDADYYYVYRATSYSGSYSKIATVYTNSYSDTGLSSDTTYYYKVKALNDDGSSGYSAIDSATTDDDDDDDYDDDELSAPSDLTATAQSSSKIRLTWDAESDADYYYVYRATSYSGSYSKIATIYTTSYTDSSLSSGTTYYYKVKALNDDGSSGYSAIDSATTDDDDLSPPEDLNAVAQSSSKIRLTWDAQSQADYYYVYRAKSYSGSYSKIATVYATSYTDTGLAADTTYYYKLKAFNSSGSSDYSSVDSATTHDADNQQSEPTDPMDVV